MQVRRMMKALDKDGSGKLSFEEFVNLLFCLMYDIEP
jgi:Ca2+-binding EF-hand superfamily protein